MKDSILSSKDIQINKKLLDEIAKKVLKKREDINNEM